MIYNSQNETDKNNQETMDLGDLLRLVLVNRGMFLSVTLLTTLLIAAYGYFKGPRYTASVILGVTNPNSSVEEGRLAILGAGNENGHRIPIIGQIARSPEFEAGLLEEVAKTKGGLSLLRSLHRIKRVEYGLGLHSAKLSSEELRKIPKPELEQILLGQLSFEGDNANNQFKITALAESPEETTVLAEAAAQVLMRENHKTILKKVREVRHFLEIQASDLGDKLHALEAELNGFQISSGLISASSKERNMYSQLDQFEKEYFENKAKVVGNQLLIAELKTEMQKIKGEIENPTYSASNLYLTQLQHRLSTLNYQKSLEDETSSQSTPQERKILERETRQVIENFSKALDARMAIKELAMMTPLEYYQVLEKELGEARKTERVQKSMLTGLKGEIDEKHKELERFSTDFRRIKGLERNIAMSSDIYVNLKKKLMETLIQEASTINDMTILTHATVPLEPNSLSLEMRSLLGLLLGLLLATTLVVLKESVITVVRNSQDLLRFGISHVIELPEFIASRSTSRGKSWVTKWFHRLLETESLDKTADIILMSKPFSKTSDIIRMLRMKLARPKGTTGIPGKVILITSATDGGGKSFLAANLAFASAAAGAKTLVLDLNLRSPTLSQFFQTGRGAISPESDITALSISEVSTSVAPQLDGIFSEPIENPMGLLEGDWLHTMLAEARQKYDVVLVDSPGINTSMDTLLIAAEADHLLMTVQHRHTHRGEVKCALEKLHEVYQGPITSIINFYGVDKPERDVRRIGSHKPLYQS